MHLKMLSAKWRPFCLGLNVLKGPNHQIVSCMSVCVYITVDYLKITCSQLQGNQDYKDNSIKDNNHGVDLIDVSHLLPNDHYDNMIMVLNCD